MERTGFVPEEASENKQLVPNYASFYGESIMPPSDEGKKLTPEEFQEQFPVRYDVWNTLSQSMLGHSETGVSLNNPDHIQTIKTRLHVLNQLDRYITSHHLNENGRTLRERQMTVFEDIRDHLEQGETQGYIKLSTGSGKTVIFTELAEATDLKTLIVVPRQLLVDQTVERFQQFAPNMEVGKIYAGMKERGRQVEVTTYESVLSSIANGEMNPQDYDLVVLDEVHKGLTDKRKEAVEKFTSAIKLGFTATPNYAETRKVSDFLGKEIHSMTVREAVQEGMLSPVSVYVVKTKTDITNVKVTSGGDYDPDELEKAINNKERNLAAVQTYQELMKNPDNQGQLSIAYCAGVQHARDLATEFQQRGVSAGVIYGKQNKGERKQILEDYRSGKIQVLCNARLLIEGFDEPQTGIILNVAPTASLVDAEQRGGRGLRLDPNNPNKHAIIVDIIDQTSNRKFVPITFAQIVDGAYVLPYDYHSSNGKHYPPGDQIKIDVEGVEVTTNPEEVMRIVSDHISQNAIDFVEEGDEVLNQNFLRSNFFGHTSRWSEVSQEIINEMRQEHPEYIQEKRSGANSVMVLSPEGKNEFINLMLKAGIKLKKDFSFENVATGEIALSAPALREIFVGDVKKYMPHIQQLLDEFTEKHPDYIGKRRKGPAVVQVITAQGKQEFIKRMQEAGISLKAAVPLEVIKEGDIIISGKHLEQIFIGTATKFNSFSRIVIDELERENPDYVAVRKSGSQQVKVVTSAGKDEFIRRMQKEGLQLREAISYNNVQETDLVISRPFLTKLFSGSDKRVILTAREILNSLNSEYVVNRRSGKGGTIVQAISLQGREEFIKQMQEAGFKLK